MATLQLVSVFDGSLIHICSGSVRGDSTGWAAWLYTETHLPYAVLVQRRRRSTLRRGVAGRGHFQVTFGATAPGVTFFGAPWHSVSSCGCWPPDVDEGRLKIQTARLGLASLREFTGGLKTNVPHRQCGCSLLNREGRCRDALCFRVREWMETWTRLWCVSLKLRRINDSFADSRKFGYYRLSRTVHVNHSRDRV